ncbi:MAG: BON domain-containing protein, partial [Pirellulaceae bacterium]|nr:BON domain-containing protein [Pirellulaceae bacterium]
GKAKTVSNSGNKPSFLQGIIEAFSKKTDGKPAVATEPADDAKSAKSAAPKSAQPAQPQKLASKPASRPTPKPVETAAKPVETAAPPVAAERATAAPPAPTYSDELIAEQLINALQKRKQSGELRGFNIDLKVEKGDVVLAGYVSDESQLNSVLDVARRIRGVRRVVNGIVITAPQTQPVAEQRAPLVAHPASTNQDSSRRAKLVQQPSSQPAQPAPAAQAAPASPASAAPAPVKAEPQLAAAPQPAAQPAQAPQIRYVPVYMPYQHMAQAQYAANTPLPMTTPGTGQAVTPARFDHPQLPGYAWPSYAAHPNYAAVTYPKQYSPSAWPYIGPFHPYPQVPLGWRKVTLEWDDGWWFLDFKSR